LPVRRSEEILNRIMAATLDALKIQIDRLHAGFKDPLGNTIVQDGYQVLMAAKTVLSTSLHEKEANSSHLCAFA
jgi:hypothetical protein